MDFSYNRALIKNIKGNYMAGCKTNELISSMDNALVNASYGLSLLEKRVLVLVIGKVHSMDKLSSDVVYTVTAQEYAELYGISLDTAKDELPICIEKLYQQDLIYLDTNNKKVRTRWVATIPNYDTKTHQVDLYFAPGIIPLLSELSKNFTQYKIKFLSVLSSFYGMRLYELCYMEIKKSRKLTINKYYSLEELRYMLNLGDKYPLFADFFRKIIKNPIEEINNKTNIQINYLHEGKPMFKKHGKKVIGLTLTISLQ